MPITEPVVVSQTIYELKYPSRAIRTAQRLGLTNRQNLVWSWYEPRNFGDWIGPYLFKAMTGKTPLHYPGRHKKLSRARALVTAGSILRHIQSDNVYSVWGSGIISQQDVFARPYKVLAVRGPMSRKRLIELDYPSTEVFGDPAVLMPYVLPPCGINKKYDVGIIPHYSSLAKVQNNLGRMEEVLIIDVTQRIDEVVRQIQQCKTTLSSSLHGIILSHAYHVPSTWIEADVSLQGDNVKFTDYYLSCGENVPEKPLSLDYVGGIHGLKAAGDCGTLPDHSRLVGPLWQSCPFSQNLSRATQAAMGN